MRRKDVRLVVELTEGHQTRYAEARCRRLEHIKKWQDGTPLSVAGKTDTRIGYNKLDRFFKVI